MSDDEKELLRHAIHKTLLVSASLVRTGHVSALTGLARDGGLADRAAGMILKQCFKELAFAVDPDQVPKEFRELVDEIAVLANES